MSTTTHGPGGDGLSWDTAFRFLQDALSYADVFQNDVGEIRIAEGIYFPDRDALNPNGTADRDATFSLYFGGTVQGGYAGLGAPYPD